MLTNTAVLRADSYSPSARNADAMSEDADGIDQQNDATIHCRKRFIAVLSRRSTQLFFRRFPYFRRSGYIDVRYVAM